MNLYINSAGVVKNVANGESRVRSFEYQTTYFFCL